MFPCSCVPQYLCFPVFIFPNIYVPQYLCSPESMFLSTYVPRYLVLVFTDIYFPWYLHSLVPICSPVCRLCSLGPMFLSTYVLSYLCSPLSMFPITFIPQYWFLRTYVPLHQRYLCTYVPQYLCSPVSVFLNIYVHWYLLNIYVHWYLCSAVFMLTGTQGAVLGAGPQGNWP